MAVYQNGSHFKAGGMGTKIDAAMRLLGRGGEAITANLLQMEPAVAGEARARIVTSRRLPSKPAQATAV